MFHLVVILLSKCYLIKLKEPKEPRPDGFLVSAVQRILISVCWVNSDFTQSHLFLREPGKTIFLCPDVMGWAAEPLCAVGEEDRG